MAYIPTMCTYFNNIFDIFISICWTKSNQKIRFFFIFIVFILFILLYFIYCIL